MPDKPARRATQRHAQKLNFTPIWSSRIGVLVVLIVPNNAGFAIDRTGSPQIGLLNALKASKKALGF